MNMKLMSVVILLISVSFGSTEVDDATLPHWQNLECEVSPKANLKKGKEEFGL